MHEGFFKLFALFWRILETIPTLLLLMTVTFFLLRVAPGGPFDSERVWPAAIQANINHEYELDKPVFVQFGVWLKHLAHGDLRSSFQYLGVPVSHIISQALPASAFLGGVAFLLSLLLGVFLGGIAAWQHNTWIDQAIKSIAISGVSLPPYLIGSCLVLFFSLQLEWLPSALWEEPSAAILPIFTLSVRPIAMIARLTRTSMLEVLHEDYIRTAHGKGLAPWLVIFKHALKNSLIPVITMLGPLAANLVTGSFLVEILFQIPGLGKHFVQAVLNRDYPLVMGVTLVYGAILIFANLLVDLLYTWVDPRIRVK